MDDSEAKFLDEVSEIELNKNIIWMEYSWAAEKDKAFLKQALQDARTKLSQMRRQRSAILARVRKRKKAHKMRLFLKNFLKGCARPMRDGVIG